VWWLRRIEGVVAEAATTKHGQQPLTWEGKINESDVTRMACESVEVMVQEIFWKRQTPSERSHGDKVWVR